MRIISFYIASSIIKSTLLVWFVFVLMSVLFGYLGELPNVKGNYDNFAAFKFASFSSVNFAIKIFPLSLLVGGVFALGKLSNQSELTVIFASGVAQLKILKMVLLIGFVLLILMMILFEVFMPRAEKESRELLNSTVGRSWFKATKFGAWMIHGDKFFHILDMKSPEYAKNLTIFSFDGIDLKRIKSAQQAHLKNDGSWMLFDVTSSTLTQDSVSKYNSKSESIKSDIEPDMITNIQVTPDKLGSKDLLAQRQFLIKNNLLVADIDQELWKRVSYPFSALVMLFFAFPIVLKSNRNVSLSQKVFLGVMLGVVYFVLTVLIERLFLMLAFPAWLGVYLPIIIFFVIAYYMYKKP